jgi:hypothetical protein
MEPGIVKKIQKLLEEVNDFETTLARKTNHLCSYLANHPKSISYYTISNSPILYKDTMLEIGILGEIIIILKRKSFKYEILCRDNKIFLQEV